MNIQYIKLSPEQYKQYVDDMKAMGRNPDKTDHKEIKFKRPIRFLDGTVTEYSPQLIPALEKGIERAKDQKTKNEIQAEIDYIKTQVNI